MNFQFITRCGGYYILHTAHPSYEGDEFKVYWDAGSQYLVAVRVWTTSPHYRRIGRMAYFYPPSSWGLRELASQLEDGGLNSRNAEETLQKVRDFLKNNSLPSLDGEEQLGGVRRRLLKDLRRQLANKSYSPGGWAGRVQICPLCGRDLPPNSQMWEVYSHELEKTVKACAPCYNAERHWEWR